MATKRGITVFERGISRSPNYSSDEDSSYPNQVIVKHKYICKYCVQCAVCSSHTALQATNVDIVSIRKLQGVNIHQESIFKHSTISVKPIKQLSEETSLTEWCNSTRPHKASEKSRTL